MSTLARRERQALCDLAVKLGESAPTLCGDWTAHDLLAHLWIREHRPLAAAGIAVPRLAGLTERAQAQAARRPLADLADAVRSPGLTPFAVSRVDAVANTLEYLVHHEDLRRAQLGWEPRRLTRRDLGVVWRQLGVVGRLLVRPAGVPVVLHRPDTEASLVLRRGEPAVVVSGPVVELAMFLHGRRQLRDLHLEGPPELEVRLWESDLGA